MQTRWSGVNPGWPRGCTAAQNQQQGRPTWHPSSQLSAKPGGTAVFLWPPVQTETERSPRYVGPYEIKKIILRGVIKLKLPPALELRPAFHASLLKPLPLPLRNSLKALRSQCQRIFQLFESLSSCEKHPSRLWQKRAVLHCSSRDTQLFYIWERLKRPHWLSCTCYPAFTV